MCAQLSARIESGDLHGVLPLVHRFCVHLNEAYVAAVEARALRSTQDSRLDVPPRLAAAAAAAAAAGAGKRAAHKQKQKRDEMSAQSHYYSYSSDNDGGDEPCEQNTWPLQDANVAPDPRKVGVLLDYSSSANGVAIQYEFAAQLAIDLLGEDAEGRRAFEPIFANIDNTAAEAVEVAQALYYQGVRYFVGPAGSTQLAAVVEWADAQADDVLFFSPASTSISLAGAERAVRLMAPDNVMADRLLQYVLVRFFFF